MAKIINGTSLPDMPWENKPVGTMTPVWRYSGNPVIDRHINHKIDRTYNSAVIPFNGEYIGVFRGDMNNGVPRLFVGHSRDALHFEIEEEPIHFVDENGNPLPDTEWQYDPRVIPMENHYYVVWCDCFEGAGATIAIAVTDDFKTFKKFDQPFLTNNRNGVLFPRKINGKYYMLSRPSDLGHTPFGDVYLSESRDLTYWGRHRLLIRHGWSWWNSLKIGGGPAPIETDEGWLIFIHGVQNNCNGYVYSAGAVIVDKDDPTKILYQCDDYLLTPSASYENNGVVPNVVFPTAVLADQDTGRMAIYYGSADTYTCLAFTTVDEIVNYIKEHTVR